MQPRWALRMETAGEGYIVAFYNHTHPLTRLGAFVQGEAPHAICLAALSVIEGYTL